MDKSESDEDIFEDREDEGDKNEMHKISAFHHEFDFLGKIFKYSKMQSLHHLFPVLQGRMYNNKTIQILHNQLSPISAPGWDNHGEPGNQVPTKS